MGHCEEPLTEGVQPEEFVAIADYSATDETQVAVDIGAMFCGFQHAQFRIR